MLQQSSAYVQDLRCRVCCGNRTSPKSAWTGHPGQDGNSGGWTCRAKAFLRTCNPQRSLQTPSAAWPVSDELSVDNGCITTGDVLKKYCEFQTKQCLRSQRLQCCHQCLREGWSLGTGATLSVPHNGWVRRGRVGTGASTKSKA